ncbi:hypothetical protein S40288_02692 [Stachybotrys chartarum IBT 40288]|nr:hypothetical protein S40288_02692 [Stachybotrys chartarum IBT 40288]
MSRFSHYDTDEERLPEGMKRVGYDADTQVYTFRDADGSFWESAPGCEYGRLTQVGHSSPADDDDDDSVPFLNEDSVKTSWRNDMMPLLNFGLLIGVFLLGLIWYLHWTAPSYTSSSRVCPESTSLYKIMHGDTCWDIGQKFDLPLDDITSLNQDLDCTKLRVGTELCLPA